MTDLSVCTAQHEPPRVKAVGLSSKADQFDQSTMVDRTGQSLWRRFSTGCAKL
jgi:hypothetical protein